MTYTYDAWGNIISMYDTTSGWQQVGTANPFRYRSYYDDNETGMSCLRSRRCDPNT